MHAWCSQPGPEAIQGTRCVEPEEAEQPAPRIQRRPPFLHWKPTRAVGGTDCDLESGAAFSGDEAHWPATRVGFHIWIQGFEESSRNDVKTSSELRLAAVGENALWGAAW